MGLCGISSNELGKSTSPLRKKMFTFARKIRKRSCGIGILPAVRCYKNGKADGKVKTEILCGMAGRLSRDL